MKMFKLIANKGALLAASLIMLSGCSNSSSGGGSGGGGKFPGTIPDSISNKPVPSQPLAPNQKSEFMRLMKETSYANVPGMLTPPANETQGEKQERENKLNQASPDVRGFAQILQGKCQIIAGTKNETGKIEKPGDSVSSAQTRLMESAGCPISWKESSASTINLVSADQVSQKAIYNIEANSSSAFKFVDPTFSNSVDIEQLNTNSSGVGRLEFGNNTIASYSKFNISGSAKDWAGQVVTLQGSGEALSKNNMNQNRWDLTFTYKGTQYIYSAVSSSEGNGIKVNHYYLNGEELPEAPEGLDLFGIN